MEPFYIKQFDLQPYYYVQVKDSDGEPVDLAGATIVCTMKKRDGTLIINRQTTGINVSSASNGDFEYQWQSSDTQLVGKHNIEFEVTPSSGGKFTVPANPDEKAKVFIIPGLDTS